MLLARMLFYKGNEDEAMELLSQHLQAFEQSFFLIVHLCSDAFCLCLVRRRHLLLRSRLAIIPQVRRCPWDRLSSTRSLAHSLHPPAPFSPSEQASALHHSLTPLTA